MIKYTEIMTKEKMKGNGLIAAPTMIEDHENAFLFVSHNLCRVDGRTSKKNETQHLDLQYLQPQKINMSKGPF